MIQHPEDEEGITTLSLDWLDTLFLYGAVALLGIAAAFRWSVRNWDELLLRAAMVGSVAACLYALGGI